MLSYVNIYNIVAHTDCVIVRTDNVRIIAYTGCTFSLNATVVSSIDYAIIDYAVIDYAAFFFFLSYVLINFTNFFSPTITHI